MINLFPSTVNPFQGWGRGKRRPVPLQRPNLAILARNEAQLPQFVRECPVAMKYLRLLAPLDWSHFPERPTNRPWPGPKPHPRAPFVAAYLVKLHQGHTYMSQLRTFLLEHPALVWILGFKLTPSHQVSYGFDVAASVPSRKQLGRVLRDMANEPLQFLLDCTVNLLQQELPASTLLGDEISLDTKHIIAWVKQNNPNAYLKTRERLDKNRQPSADRDCKLGCKKKSNQTPKKATSSTKKVKRLTQYDWTLDKKFPLST